MAYDDAAYLRGINQLEEAVWILLDNEATADQIHGEVDNAIENAEGE